MCPGSARHFLHPVILVGCRSSLLRRPAACGCAVACPGRVHNRPHARTPLPATTDGRAVPRHLLHHIVRDANKRSPAHRSQLSYARTYHLGNRSTRLLAHNARRFPCCVPGWAPSRRVNSSKDRAMVELIPLCVSLLIGFVCGYLVRTAISARRQAASKRYLLR